MKKYYNDKEMFELIEQKLYTGVVCDTMDEIGYRNQAMRTDIRPILMDYVVAGRAKTMLAVDVYEIEENPYEKEIEAIDSIRDNEVVIASTNRSVRNGMWGELHMH